MEWNGFNTKKQNTSVATSLLCSLLCWCWSPESSQLHSPSEEMRKAEPQPPSVKEEEEEPQPPSVKEEEEEPQPPSVKEEEEEPQSPSVKEEEEEPQPPYIKEEEEELSITQDKEHLLRPDEDDLTRLPLTGVSVKTEDHEDKPPESSQLHHSPSEEMREAVPSCGSSLQHMTTEADGDHLFAPLSDSDDTTSHSPEDEDSNYNQESLSSDTDCEETSQAIPDATATTAQAGAAADEDFDDEPEEVLTQDQPDNEEQPPGDDQPEKGRAAGAEDSVSQHPHLERDDEQRQPQKKSRRKALLLDNDTQEQLFEWVREHELLWRKGATDYKNTKKKTELWTRKARELDIEEGAKALRTWWKSVRDLYTKLLSKKSGQAAPNLTDRELFVQRNCAFLHKEVKPRKGQPLRSIPLTQEPVASQPPAAQPSASASTSRQPSRDVEEQEEDEGSLSLIETQAAVTRSMGTPSPAPSSTTTRPRRAATRAEPEDSPAMLEIRDCMKATNALMERLVQAQEISHARQPFITYMSQSLQRLPEAQYQLTVERMTAILHEMQQPIPHPLPPAPPRPASVLSPTLAFYQQPHYFQPQPQHHGFQQEPLDFQQQSQPQHQPQHVQQLTPRVSQPSSTPRSSNEGLMLSDMPNFSSINHTNMSAVSEGGILQDLQRQEMNAPPIPITTSPPLLAEMRATTEEN
ncbi:cilia- and flagella-associated protein 251-like isoform X2 [Dunckerocampus dactyliophorus]|uniref:cilia- and flagella-associated protein 251-like isoform X2 n=1 Tax=Dunckerocampus dactyliophorus TaxID=161453 RepID=UPI002406BCE5|nr:cilia- and flagella-associated protein 251-like isoform X2 [Dunckerocampus dactyliophorus]